LAQLQGYASQALAALIAELATRHHLVTAWAQNHLLATQQTATGPAEKATFLRAARRAEASLVACFHLGVWFHCQSFPHKFFYILPQVVDFCQLAGLVVHLTSPFPSGTINGPRSAPVGSPDLLRATAAH
jgi:hypothetical protein